MKISVAAAGIVDATILALAGTTVQLNTQANATLVASAVIVTGFVEGEVIAINTTPARSGVILKISGNNITIDTTFGSTEAARTITYNAAVFKAWAAITA